MNPIKTTKSELKQELAIYQHHTQALQQTLARTQAQVEMYQTKVGLLQRGWTAANGRANESREVLALLHMVILMKETRIEDLKNLLGRMTMAVLTQSIELEIISEELAMECDTTTVLQQIVAEKEAHIEEAIRKQEEICEKNKRSMAQLASTSKDCMEKLTENYKNDIGDSKNFIKKLTTENTELRAQLNKALKLQLIPMVLLGILGLYILYVTLTARQNM